MSKSSTTLLMLALLFCSSLSRAARPEPHPLEDNTLVYSQHKGVEAQQVEAVGESCEGVGDEECLMRRTLAAHVDYIYTQSKQKP